MKILEGLASTLVAACLLYLAVVLSIPMNITRLHDNIYVCCLYFSC